MKFLALLVTLALAPLGTANAAVINNGSFENGPAPGSYVTLPANSSDVVGWTTGLNGVDYIGSYWAADDGDRSIDLNSIGSGSIFTTIDGLLAGRTYEIVFAMSGNPMRTPREKSLEVTVGDTVSAVFSVNTTLLGVTPQTMAQSMNWAQKSLRFVAQATQSVLRFASTTPGAAGPAIDNVRISAVPLPATGLLLIGAFVALASLRRRKVV